MNIRRIAAGVAAALTITTGGLALAGQPAGATERPNPHQPRFNETCHSVSSCNGMISNCIKFGGDFYVHSVDQFGRPAEGGCTHRTD